MSSVIYAEGTIITQGSRGEVRIYVKKAYWGRLKPLVGKSVRLIILVDEDEGS